MGIVLILPGQSVSVAPLCDTSFSLCSLKRPYGDERERKGKMVIKTGEEDNGVTEDGRERMEGRITGKERKNDPGSC